MRKVKFMLQQIFVLIRVSKSFSTRVFLSFLLLFYSSFSFSEQINSSDHVNIHPQIYYCGYPVWYDDWYCEFNQDLDNTVNKVNDWFYVTTPNPSSKRATASGLIRLGWEPRSGSLAEFDSRFKIRVKLPALENRVELLFTDEEDNIDQQPVKAARNRELGNQEDTTLALQFREDEKSPMSYRIGFGRGSQLYTRARYSQRHQLSEQTSINYFTELHYFSADKFGAELNGQYIKRIKNNQAFEFNNNFRYSDKRNDWSWRHELKYLYLLDSEQSLLFTALVDGLSQPNHSVRQTLLSIRYKRNVLRPWLFIEVEPYVLWLREENFRTSYGLAMRFEVHFPDGTLL